MWGNQSRNTVQQVVQRLGDVSLPPGPFVALILGTVTPPFGPYEGTAVTLGTPPLPEPVSVQEAVCVALPEPALYMLVQYRLHVTT